LPNSVSELHQIFKNQTINSDDSFGVSVSPDQTYNDDRDDTIRKIKGGIIFKEIRFNFNPNAYENFENNVKILKQIYEDKVGSLEKNMDYYKSYLENYYRKKIQKTRNSHMENIEYAGDNFPIINITSEHNEKLKMLRELYDEKMKEMEQVSYMIFKLNYRHFLKI
jgi:hypothetical protein